MPAAVDDVLDVLREGKWHTIEDIETKCRDLNENQVELILSFLEQAGFVERRRKRWSLKSRMARLTPRMLGFLQRLEELKT